jgi:TPR repeat
MKNFYLYKAHIIIFGILFLLIMHENLYAQKKIQTKRVHKIKEQLNDFKINSALGNIQKLVNDEPYSPFYNELQVNVLQQIIQKIKYAKDESDVTVQTSYLDADKKVVQDTIDWENDSDTAMLQFERPSVPMITEKPIAPKQDSAALGFKKKKKKWFQFEDENSTETKYTSGSFIDSSIIKYGTPSNNTETLTVDDIDKPAVAADNGGAPNGFEKTKSKNEKLAAKLLEIQNGYASMDTKVYVNALIASARQSTLWVEYADSASKFLREYLIDTQISRHIWKDSAITFLESGDEHLDNKEFEEALTDYNTAMMVEPTMVNIYLKMGDAYMHLGEDSMGNIYYKTAVSLDTTSPNVHYHLAQFHFKRGDFQKALYSVVDAILIYPDKMFFDMIKEIANKTAHDFNSQWVPRFVYPISTKNKFEELVVDDKNPWFYYQAAKSDYASYANENGIMRFNELTNEKYLEVACFLRMLDSTKDVKELQFARNMRKIGFLDCYVLVSLFHYDLYAQYKDLVHTDSKKVATYLYMLLNWHKHKFDAVKKEDATIVEKVEDKKGKKKK